MLIENGELLSGIICKKTVGTAGNSLVHIIAAERGPEVAKEFYGDIQKVTNNYFLVEGHSIGVYSFLCFNPTCYRGILAGVFYPIEKSRFKHFTLNSMF